MDVLLEMISSNSDLVRAKDADGYTPLHRASYGNHLEAMQVRPLVVRMETYQQMAFV